MKQFFIVLAVMALSVIACGGSSTPVPTGTPEEKAWYACTYFIQQQLGLSTRDAQRYTASGVKTLEENHYQVEVYYAQQGDTYRCELSRHENGDMQLLGLETR